MKLCIYNFDINKTINKRQTNKSIYIQINTTKTKRMASFTFTKSQLDTFLKEIVSNHCNSEFEVKDLKKLIPKGSKNKKVKDPNAPKRATTAYFIFMADVRDKVKEENPNLKSNELSKIMGQMWRDMDSSDKKKYEDLAEKDKERYKEEMESYSSSDSSSSDSDVEVSDSEEKKEKKEKKKKDPNAPKRATTAYFYFMDEVRDQVKEENPDVKPAERTKIMGKMWRELEDKSKYEEMNENDKVRYKKEKEEYEASK